MTERVPASPKAAWVIGLLYGPIFIALLIIFGGDYDEITDSAENFRSAVVIPLAIMTVVLVVLTTWLGWWRSVLHEDRRTSRWMLSVPAVLGFGLVLSIALDSGRTADLDTSFVVWVTIAAVGVGFCEELVYRGLTVVGFRAGHRELQVWLYSSLLFGVLHLWNFVAGQGVGATIVQFAFTFVLGSVFYVCRRATGTIIVPMVLHGLWDWNTFTGGSEAYADGAEATDSVSSVATFFGVVAVILCIIGARRLFTHEVEPAQAR